jgi:hypothetical protein
MPRTEQLVGLTHERAVRLKLILGGRELIGFVGKQVQRDGPRRTSRIEVNTLVVAPGKDW